MKKKILNSPKQAREEDIVVSINKMDKPDEETSQTNSIDGSIAEVEALLKQEFYRKESSQYAGDIKNDEEAAKNTLAKDLNNYTFNNSKYDKALEMFVNAFSACVGGLNKEKVNELSYKIVEYIIEMHLDTFPKTVRSKSHNLKENAKLCNKVYNGVIGPRELVKMSIEDMQTDDLRDKDNEYIKDSLLSSQIPTAIADTEIFLCGKCKQRKCTYYQLQTRSCDEPMTTFVTCTVCANKWKF